MAERRVTVEIRGGAARPARRAVRPGRHEGADGRRASARPDADPVNAKSILSVIGLDVRHGEEIVITAEGDGADGALDELAPRR